MPILGFMLACTVILAGGLFGISAVLNAPPVKQESSGLASSAVAEQDRSSGKESVDSANRDRLAKSLINPVVVKRETDVEAGDHPLNNVSAAPAANAAHSGLETASDISSKTQFLGRIVSVPPSPPSPDVTSIKSDGAPVKSAERPDIAKSNHRQPDVESDRKDRVAKDKERSNKDVARRTIREHAKRKAVAKRAPIPSREELDELIGFESSSPQEVVVYHTFE